VKLLVTEDCTIWMGYVEMNARIVNSYDIRENGNKQPLLPSVRPGHSFSFLSIHAVVY
jgi:hypothetical protein